MSAGQAVRRLLVAVAVFVAASGPTATAQPETQPVLLPRVDPDLERRIAIIARESANQPDQAISPLRDLLASAEQKGQADERVVLHTMLAQFEASARHLDQAIGHLNKALRITTAYPLPFYLRAAYDIERGNAERALRDLNKAIELEPRFDRPRNLRARLHHDSRRYPEALADYAAYLARRQEDEGARHLFATALQQSGQPAKALIEIDRVLARHPANPILLTDKAKFLSAVKDDARAIQLIDKVIQEGGSKPVIHMVRGKINLTRGDHASAEIDLKKAFDLALAGGVPNPYSALYLEVARLHLGRADPADTARRLELANARAWHSMLGDALNDRISNEALLANGQEVVAAVDHAGPLAEAHFFIAQRELLQGRRDAAIAAYQAAVASGATWTPEYEWSRRELERLARP